MENLNLKNKTKKVVLTQKGMVNKSVQNMLLKCTYNAKDRKVYTGYYSGSGRFTSRHSAIGTVTEILTAQGYKYEVGNDAPRGGASGEYVKMSRVAFDFLWSIKKLK